MNIGVKRQRDRRQQERKDAEARAEGYSDAKEKAQEDEIAGQFESDAVVRYSCAEKYELGACSIDGCLGTEGTLPEPVERREARYDDPAIVAQREAAGMVAGVVSENSSTDLNPRTTMFPPGTIETFTGDSYNFENPQVANIHLADIAHALSNHCRYAGHTKRFYSVGEHSILVKEILRAQGFSHYIQLAGLFHDAHEAYVMDAPRPLKPLLGKAFEEVAAKADVVIATWLGRAANVFVRPEAFHTPDVKEADNIALVYERLQLMTAGPEKWEPGYENVPALPESLGHPHLGGTSPLGVEGAFLRHAHDLGVDD